MKEYIPLIAVFGSVIVALLTFILTWKYIRPQKEQETAQMSIKTETQTIEQQALRAETIKKLLAQIEEQATMLAAKAGEKTVPAGFVCPKEINCIAEKEKLEHIIKMLNRTKADL